MKILKSFLPIALLSWMSWSLCACAAPKQPPRNSEYVQVFEQVWSTVEQTPRQIK